MKDVKLKNAAVYYCADSGTIESLVSASGLHAYVDGETETLEIGFTIQRGKGFTELNVKFKKDDIAGLIKCIAAEIPSLAATFADSTCVAVKTHVARLKKRAKSIKESNQR